MAAGDPQWVKVEFYARVPDGQVVTDVDTAEAAQSLARVFGFSAIAGLSVVAAVDQGVMHAERDC